MQTTSPRTSLLRAMFAPTPAFFLCCALLPIIELLVFSELSITQNLRPVLLFSLLALSVTIVTGYAGILNLGTAAFMALGAYTFGILTCDIYPFQLPFWWAILGAIAVGVSSGYLLGLPTLRLRDDYLAIVTLAFGEIMQDLLRNLETITKGSQGINPLPNPTVGSYSLTATDTIGWHFLLLGVVLLVVMLCRNLYESRVGRSWLAVRQDELAALCMGISTTRAKLSAFAVAAGLSALAGALWAAQLGSTGEPGNFDFQVSVIALCAVIVGGIGTIAGALWGTLIMVGLNAIVLTKLSEILTNAGVSSTTSVFSQPNNWKYALFGLALVVIMRVRPRGLCGPAAKEAQ